MTIVDDKPNVLIFCASAYSYEESYLPIIEENYNNWNIDLLITKDHLTENILKTIKIQLNDNKIASYDVIPDQGNSRIEYYIKLRIVSREISKKKYNMLLLATSKERPQ